MSGIMQVMFFSAGSNNWVNVIKDPGNSSSCLLFSNISNTTDVYAVGYGPNVSGASTYLYKFNAAGDIQWQYRLGLAAGSYIVKLDSSGNIYVFDSALSAYFVSKVTSTGSTITSTIKLGGTVEQAYGFDYDSTYGYYLCGETYNSSLGANTFSIIRLGTSGAIQWVRQLYGTTNTGTAYQTVVDASGNSWTVGVVSGFTGVSMFVKYDSTGTCQWVKSLYYGTDNNSLRVVCVDGSSNSYISGQTAISGYSGNQVVIAKYDTSGTLQWQLNYINGNSSYGYTIDCSSICTDGTYIYLLCLVSSSPNSAAILKLDLNGNVQWQRYISAFYGYGISVSNSRMYINGYATAGSSPFGGYLISFPTDGSGTGSFTVGSYTLDYSVATFTVSTATMTNVNRGTGGSATGSSPSLTNPTYTSTASSLTVTKTSI